jgi:hypothetical protein
MDVEVTFAHQEFAARLGQAATNSDADRVDALLDEIADAGLETARWPCWLSRPETWCGC